MGAAYFIVLERKIDALDGGMNGKSLSRHIDVLDGAARQLGVTPLSEFFSADPEQLAEFMACEDVELPAVQYFAAQEGLATIRALSSHPASRADELESDLRDCERILSAAETAGVGWHFEIDF